MISLDELFPSMYPDTTMRGMVVSTLARQLSGEISILEIGSAREFTARAAETDGHLTVYLWKLTQSPPDNLSVRDLTTVDRDQYTAWINSMIFQCNDNATSVFADGMEYLTERTEPIDLLVLDAVDVGLPGYQEFHRDLYMAARDLMSPRSAVIIDDCGIDGCGKGELVLPLLIDDRYHYAVRGYTVGLVR